MGMDELILALVELALRDGKTTEEVAEALGVTRMTLWRVRHGKAKVRGEWIYPISRLIDRREV